MLIDRGGLEADAVVPQCLDNQYVSDDIFSKMVENNLDYRDTEIAQLRENDFRTEFIRSLLYSSQVVIQRAYLNNSDFLYKNYQPQDRKNFIAFAQLMRDKAVLPALFEETSLTDKLTFDTNKEGGQALKALLDEVGAEVIPVRPGGDSNEANKKAVSSIKSAFGTGISRLVYMDDDQRNAMASELFIDRHRLQEEGAWQAFNEAIDRLAGYAHTKALHLRAQGEQLRREHIYQDNFIRAGGSVALGAFKKPDPIEDPFLLELKKYVDLVYNVNLPDYFKRFTFTPAKLPSRMAMQDAPGEGYSHEQMSALLSNDDALEAVRRTFMAQAQQAMNLPLLRNLTVADVREIRALPQWGPFIKSQKLVLTEPEHCLDHLERFQQNFDAFQRALSDWYNRNYKRAHTEERYCSYISFVLSVAGKLIVAGSDLDTLGKSMAVVVNDLFIGSIPRTVKGYAAKLMVGVYDIGKRQLDTDRTYTIELMQTNTELLREDVVELLNSISRRAGRELPAASQVADQGKQ